MIARSLHLTLWLAASLWLTACGAGGIGRSLTATPAAAGILATPVMLRSGTFQVTVTAPADNSVVNVPQVIVTGLAPSETVLTIDDSLIVVDATGQFSTTVPLQEGPNQLDVLASDADGNQVSTKLFVTYDPTP